MSEKKIVIYHRDHEYVERLSNYINRHRERNMCAISFTEPTKLEEYLTENPSDVLLCEEHIADFVKLRLLVNKAFALVDSDGSKPAAGEISRFSSAEKIMNYLAAERPNGSKEIRYARITAVCKPGYETLSDRRAVELAEKLGAEAARENGKLLLLLFSPLGRLSGKEFEKNQMSELMFKIADGDSVSLSEYAGKFHQFDCICGYSHWSDADEFTTEHAKKLAGLILDSDYKYVIMSFGGLHSFMPPLLEICEKILIPQKEPAEPEKESVLTTTYTELKKQLIFASQDNLANKFEEEGV